MTGGGDTDEFEDLPDDDLVEDQDPDDPGSDPVDDGQDDDPTAGASDIGGRSGGGDDS